MMNFVFKTRNSVSKTRNCVSKTRGFALQMMNFAAPTNYSFYLERLKVLKTMNVH